MGFSKFTGDCLELVKGIVFERGHLIYWLNIPAFRRSRKQILARPKGEKVRIGFMVQAPTNWAVIQFVYEAAEKDPRVEPVVLLMPELEFFLYVKLTRIDWESTYAFGQERFGNRAVRAWNPEKKTWLNPEELRLDYIFLPRPYETYLTKAYKASGLRKHARVCYVPYSPPQTDETDLIYNLHFIRNLSLIFCEKPASEKYVRQKLARTIRTGDQQVFSLGYPKYDLIPAGAGQDSPVWPRERKPGVMRILWTPRWTMNPRLGASNFFRYREEMANLAEGDSGIDLVFRPHPLALSTYVREGWISQEELETYLARLEGLENAGVDRTHTYYDTFWSSDLLISDVSSMMMDYLCTEKPILFCPTPDGKTTSEDPSKPIGELLEGFYIVHDFQEIREKIAQLSRGEDPKREVRARLARMLKRDGQVGRSILETVKKDYFGEHEQTAEAERV